MRDQILALLKSPSRETYLALWEIVTTLPSYSPYSSQLDQAQELIDNGEYATADLLLNTLRIPQVLSPRFHFQKHIVLEKLGDQRGSDAEQALCFACITGMLATGDGTAQHPYLVSSPNDEYYVLGALELKTERQSLAEEGDRAFDVHECAGGREVYFDITRVYATIR